MAQQRLLAAILFTDIVGYTALMGEDEQKAFELLRQNRQIQQPLIKEFNGTWIKEIGDGVLASFHTVIDAVACAIEIQKKCRGIEGLKLRIGIHQGDVIFEDNDVFGDGVNIASRIQAVAPVGGIWISGAVYYNIANKKNIKTRFIRAEVLKNVKEPVLIYEVIVNNNEEKEENNGLPIEQGKSKTMPRKSVAVLPFVNMSNDPEQEYFSDGMAEEIINSLAHLQDLKVAGRMSSFQFKGAKADLRQVGKKLGVSTVLEGSVRKQGNRLRVTAQLIDVEDGFHLWSEKYDRDIDDIFAIQDEIALAITERLKVTLLEKDRERITKPPTQNAQAYDLYLKGTFHISRRGSSILTGLEYFKRAIALDPGFALAYTGCADAYILASFYSCFPGNDVMQNVKEVTETAIKLDSSRSESYCTLGQYYSALHWDWVEAERNYLRSIAHNPRFAQAHSLYGLVCFGFWQGKFDEAEREGRIGIKLEPLSAIGYADLSWILCMSQKFEEALTVAQTGIELDSNSFLSWRLTGLSYLGLKRYGEAIHTFKNLIKISNGHQHAIHGLIWAYCANGDLQEAGKLLDKLRHKARSEYVAATNLAVSAALMGDISSALSYLDKAYNDRDAMLITIKHSTHIPDALRNETGFQDLLNRIGFPDF